MFTGIVEDLGIVLKKSGTSKGARLAVRFQKIRPRLKDGESIAVNGVCLTAAKIIPGGFEADLVRETLKATTLGELLPGAQVHLEQALSFGGRLGGHSISGHVDGRGKVVRNVRQGRQRVLSLQVPAGLRRFCLRKGSLAVDGVSLTIQDVAGGIVKIALIPHTLKKTMLGTLREGNFVNLEADRLARRALRVPSAARPRRETAAAIRQRLEKFKRQGF